ncbi:Lysophosphatidylcholine acyltransferase [Erysiphe neolycopersici]|uniref:Tafazzin family protein n=1 Tax=Erysiphe neolycopersici TaxID=212602 RepID=A0A420HZG0_9PEZI|nr:Lysophosphatidylcholine acyltransferase [Erysiphe neolycopersici]
MPPHETPPYLPSLSWRFLSSSIMGVTGSLSRIFLYGLNGLEVVGLERFLERLDKRSDIEGRKRGLVTVANHVSVVDDPLIWGVMPFSYAFNPSNLRWSLGSYDICFKSRLLSAFFSYGQVLPTHRNAHSKYGGLFQPTMSQAIRLLSAQPFTQPSNSQDLECCDPFTTGNMTYTTTGSDIFPSPTYYPSRKYSWIHIFPEGRVHQHPHKTLRYFKWGISRLILESEPMPEVIPIFIDGNQEVMAEDRGFPEFLPRTGKHIRIAFGEIVDDEKVFGELRERWKQLVKNQKEMLRKKGINVQWEMGELSDDLKFGNEAVEIRKEVTKRVRNEILKLRRNFGYPDEDPKHGLVETWIQEGSKVSGKMNDGSWVGET